VNGVGHVGEQLFIGVRGAAIQQHLYAVARPGTSAEHADSPRHNEVARRHVVVRSELAEALDLRLEQLDPGRTLNRFVVELAKCRARRADVAAAVFQLVKGVDQLTVGREQIPSALHAPHCTLQSAFSQAVASWPEGEGTGQSF